MKNWHNFLRGNFQAFFGDISILDKAKVLNFRAKKYHTLACGHQYVRLLLTHYLQGLVLSYYRVLSHVPPTSWPPHSANFIQVTQLGNLAEPKLKYL